MDLRDRLLEAMEAQGWTYDSLLERSGLSCTVSSLCRKLNRRQGLVLDEARKLTRCLDVRVEGLDECRAIERRLGAAICWPSERLRAS